ncbi:oxidoreductase [soil metagenome]
MIVYTPPRAATHIPVIDLTGSFSDPTALARVGAEIHRACRETGFFYVSGHGVPQAIMDGEIEIARQFFAQPADAKQAVAIERSSCRRGYEAGLQVLDPGSPPDLKESFMLGRELPPEHAYVAAGIPMHGPNLWPDLPGFREQAEAYEREMIRLGRHLMACLAVSLDLQPNWFAEGLKEPQAGVRLLSYPPQPEDVDSNRLGAGAHTDWGSITILLQDDMAGLEVRNADDDWILATPIRGTFVINIGQMMERFTAGLYRANLHRVRNNSADRARNSVATFFELDYFYKIGRAPTVPDDPGYVVDSTLSVGEHIEQMARASYGG